MILRDIVEMLWLELGYILTAVLFVVLVILAWQSTYVPQCPIFVMAVPRIEPVLPRVPDSRPEATFSPRCVTTACQTEERVEKDSTKPAVSINSETPESSRSVEERLLLQRPPKEDCLDLDFDRTQEVYPDPELEASSPLIISVRIKYSDDSQKTVAADSTETLQAFKRKHFVSELGENRIVKLILNGQVLSDENRTLCACGFYDNCVVLCHIHPPTGASIPLDPSSHSSDANTSLPSSLNLQSPTDVVTRSGMLAARWAYSLSAEPGQIMLPMFGVILCVVWLCRIEYRQYFSATATFALLCLTGLFVISLISVIIPTQAPANANIIINTPPSPSSSASSSSSSSPVSQPVPR